MKKPLKFFLVFAVAFVITIAVNIYVDDLNYYKSGENATYYLSVEDTFDIKLDDNGSTGQVITWLVMPNAIKLMDKQTEPTMQAALKTEGAGAISTFTFKALKAGNYKLLAAQCPPGTTCALQNTKPDNVFTVSVSE
jgi:predicted secreted protein